MGIIGAIIVLFFISLAIVGPWISPYSPFSMSANRSAPPGTHGHIMGTDEAGRDVFSQFLHGGKISLLVGVIASLISGVVGTIIGAISGFYGGRIDYSLMRVTEIFMIIPRFFLALVIVAIFGSSILNIVIVIGILGWPTTARLMRAQFLSVRELDYVEAAKVIGASNLNIVWDEVFPNAYSPVLVSVALDVGRAVLLESEMSFLGLGDPNLWSWGYMIFTGKSYLTLSPWRIFLPGLGISLMVIAFYIIGEALNKILNPRLRTRI